ncbi:MAG: type IV secretory system conjugative DNA transfer family protein [Pseudomonadota bacterium]
MYQTNFNPEDDRFGTAGFASGNDVRRADLRDPSGVPVGFKDGSLLKLGGDALLITVGGAGSGKLRDLLSYALCMGPSSPMIVLDPRGELAAISIHTLAPRGVYGYCWNPLGMHHPVLPQHACNPLDILKPDSPHFHSDCDFISEGLIPLSGGGNGKYFELRAREWLSSFMKAGVEYRGRINLPDLYEVIGVIETDPNAWADELEKMLASRFPDVRRNAGEMLAKQQDSPKEFSGILGEIYAHLSFLNDPHLRAALSGDGRDCFSLEALTNPTRRSRVHLNVPAEYLSVWSPVIRLFFTVTMLYKARCPERERILLLVDEAGQLGRFEALLRAFTYGRGAGVRAWAIFQDVGQITRNFGASALQGFLGSAQLRQFMGVRDFETAKLVSSMLGTQTLSYDDDLAQGRAQKNRRNSIRKALMEDADPFEFSFDRAQFGREEVHRTKQARALLTPDEILSLPEDKQILFVSGKNIKPILADKYPYYARREMAGFYLPNPYHPPQDSVTIRTSFGSSKRAVRSGPIPENLRHFPQYQHGMMYWIDGFSLAS